MCIIIDELIFGTHIKYQMKYFVWNKFPVDHVEVQIFFKYMFSLRNEFIFILYIL